MDAEGYKAVQEIFDMADTAVVVNSASRVEAWLASAIRTKMRSDLPSRVRDRMFTNYGPLNTFSGKIDIAYAFSIVDVETYNELRAIKDIRNRFAHARNFIKFDDPEISRLMQKLSGWTADAIQNHLFMD